MTGSREHSIQGPVSNNALELTKEYCDGTELLDVESMSKALTLWFAVPTLLTKKNAQVQAGLMTGERRRVWLG